MTSDRVLKLFVVVAVLVTAWYAGHEEGQGMAMCVATVGLATAFWRPVLAIPTAVAMAAAAVYVPGVAIAATVGVFFLGTIAFFVKMALTYGPMPGSSVTPGDGQLYIGGDVDGGGIDGGLL
jgi:hypothetical protein